MSDTSPIKVLGRFELGEDVIVIKEGSENFNRIGVVWKLRNYNDNPKISVSFDGEIFNYRPEDLDLA
ncbi:hypothetical protein [Oleidesulfovibrio alaskensis]|jgi:hypothetical protein|uniref:hypothetical protein n=1 Tax=Oleidesulfovibrio alaskensis TaxID=58180 RepID=UPI0000393A50|nr:hypothetical protein [Oleidesulfovibrio alaskensis]MBL3580799.1 hypothetical protein [Oleidesulfovibrio alaskensis]